MSTLWEHLEESSGKPVPLKVRDFLRRRGLDETVWAQAANNKRAQLAEQATIMLTDLRDSGLFGNETESDTDPEARPGVTDPRWALWRDLRAGSDQPEGWQPLTATRVLDGSTRAGLSSDRVEVSFDCRMSQAAVLSSLRKLWPRIISAGWVRPTKTVETRAAVIVRFVCLEQPPGTSWRDMMGAWNATHPTWAHADVRDFERRFRRAEKQLTGHDHGLKWFYDPQARPEAWAHLTLGELEQMEERGYRRPAPLEERARQLSGPVVYGITLRLGRFAAHAQRLAGEGLTARQIHKRMLQESDDWRAFAADSTDDRLLRFIDKSLLNRQSPDLGPGPWRFDA